MDDTAQSETMNTDVNIPVSTVVNMNMRTPGAHTREATKETIIMAGDMKVITAMQENGIMAIGLG